ncbi:hypothetical protein [Streptomyces uncialis]|uniref:hypothetical protein n=1 Tax=Streptomyces uncialis TaxID=1048205 RepID=UPI0033E773AC
MTRTITSTCPPLSIESRSDWLAGALRVDQIRTDTLVQLVAGWGDEDTRDDVIAALDALAAVVTGIRREGELDAAVEEIEAVASMDTAQVEIRQDTALRLHAELGLVAERLGRFGQVRGAA